MRRRLTLSTLKDVSRRLAVQTLVSGTVMAGLNLAVNVDLASIALPWPLGGEMHVPAAPASSSASAPSVGRARYPGPVEATIASGKAERLSLPRKVATAGDAAVGAIRPTDETVPAVTSDVVLFDQCMPTCESRDPLLPANRSPAKTASLPPAPTAAPATGLSLYTGDAGPSAVTSSENTGLLRAASSRIAAVGQAGFRAVEGGLASITPW